MGGRQFFTSWPLWQKMTFVLGCSIAITIVLGFMKLFVDRRRLSKYTKVDKGKQAQTPEMLEAQPVTAVSTETKDEIPFGIRAIQSGIEVDGVWISRSNTPVGSSRASIMSDHKPMRSYNNSQLELPQTAKNGSSRGSSRPPSSFDRAVSAERIPTNDYDSRSSSPGRGLAPTQRCSNCSHSISRNSATLQALETPRSAPISGPPSPRNGTRSSSNKSSRRTSDESDYMAIQHDVRAYENAYIRPASVQAPIDPRTDLDLLQSHRLSHVAETGQLTPRVRRPGNSGEWASVAEHQISSLNGVNYFVPQKTPSPPLPPIIDPPDEEIGLASSYNPTQDGHAANEARQAVPLTESYAPKAAYYPDAYQPRGPHHQYSYDEVPYEVNTDQNQRESQVLRKVNAGFEILRPGTFQPPTPAELELADRRQSKKLQKKRRSSSASRKSAFVEQV
ncbi:uncharacterized protein K460DRAFT_380757 [Cucurbitaria berberidis CBS 394.84]|uniref:Uncharacterized protein n=1 Tax=Cucurbitaria berberidis CBS 394.84 TaxID=1168544 RepID=A0A9P4G8P5_9PLEO|nr:uncharacterized protein K460DRAFT_380757 [Cucurbitaria berberidis CBS 394.84]KAF1841019.1 hypothetical protein K460DRAFT_380757 [Cucurbitaria berberidis CBS 394.84]